MNLIGATRRMPPILPVSGIAYYKQNETHYLSRHKTIDFGFELSSSAEEAVFEIDGIRHSRKFPWISTRIPGPAYRMLTPAPWEVLAVTYEAKHLDFFREHGIDPAHPGWEFAITPRISNLLSDLQIQMEILMTPGAADRIDLLCLELLMECVLSSRISAEEQGVYYDRIQRIASYLRMHADRVTNLNEVLDRYHISRRTFFRYWEKYFDCAPAAFLTQCRIEQVCELLVRTDQDLSEIADRTGFSNSSYLCTAFRNVKGISPRQFRKKFRAWE